MNTFMDEAINLSIKSFENNEVPVGAVIVRDNKIISSSGNNRHNDTDVLGHAEIIAILKAQKKLNSWRLDDCELYVTLKPCSMCMEIIKESRISKIYYLVDKPLQKKGYSQTKIEKLDDYSCQKKQYYLNLLSDFFKNKR